MPKKSVFNLIAGSSDNALKRIEKIKQHLKKGDMRFEELAKRADQLHREGKTPEEIDAILLADTPVTAPSSCGE